ncbi:MAG: hypothetical protein NVS9B10_15080 [Nevskia sp.]
MTETLMLTKRLLDLAEAGCAGMPTLNLCRTVRLIEARRTDELARNFIVGGLQLRSAVPEYVQVSQHITYSDDQRSAHAREAQLAP